MRKLLSYVIVFTMLFSSFSFIAMPKSTSAAPVNKQATFIANRFVKLGFDRDGLPLYPTRLFPWQKTANIQVWGRDGYPMPHAYYAQVTDECSNVRVNIPARDIDNDVETFEETNVVPVMWTDFYLTVYPNGGKSTEYDHFYAVLDSAGQLWFDPDGTFHDPRYHAYFDPRNDLYREGSCRTGINPYAVDPSSDNNTQGPYILNPSHPLYNANSAITVSLKGRKFQLGYVDMVDYLPERVITSDNNLNYSNRPNDEDAIKFNPTVVIPYQWDIGLPLVNFRTQWTWPGNEQFPNQVFEGDEMFHQYHARTDHGYSISVNLGGAGSAGYSTYDPYEYIYRKGPGNLDLMDGEIGATATWFSAPQPIVQVGDIRLSDISVKTWDGSNVFNYPANSVVKVGDADAPQDYDHNGILEIDEYKILSFFYPYMKHTETLYDGRNLGNLADITNIFFDVEQRDDLSYTISEWIYRDRDFDLADGEDPNGDGLVSSTNVTDTRVQPDTRYSPVNSKMALARPFNVTLLNGNEPYSVSDFNRTLVGAYPWNYQDQPYREGLGLVGWDAITKAQGDMLILSEMLRGGCESPTYDLSVQTDAWMGTDVGISGGDKKVMPSFTAARLRSPNGDIETNSQRIQKNTVLGPNGTSFFIPATTFHNIKLEYREYIGVEIFKDNGIDNHIGINLPQDKLYEQNLSDDYQDERTGEEFLGAVNGVNAKDYGLSIIPFPLNFMYYDTNHDRTISQYGCGEPIYKIFDDKKAFPNLMQRPFMVMEGDFRVSGITVNQNGNEIHYAPGTYVTAGDADVGFGLNPFNPDMYGFVDKEFPERGIELNRQYDLGEYIYRNRDLFYPSFIPTNENNEPIPYQNTYPGEWLRFVYTDQANFHAVKSVPLYLDLDNNMKVSPDDVRMSYILDKKAYGVRFYPLYSNVSMGDSDLGLPLNTPPRFGYGDWYYNSFNDLYIDTDLNGYVSGHSTNTPSCPQSLPTDIRLTEQFGYPVGSTPYDKHEDGYWQDWENNSKPDDKDIGLHYGSDDPAVTRNYYDPINPSDTRISRMEDGRYFLEITGNYGQYDGIGMDILLSPRTVDSNFVRLTPVSINGTSYQCGSSVSTGDFWYYQNPIRQVSMGYNCDFRFIDEQVQPGTLEIQVKMDQPLQVELTTNIDIALTTPLTKDETVHLVIEDVYAFGNQNKYVNPGLIYRELDVNNQTATVQLTPYRGSCGTSSTSYPLRIWAFKESGGVSDNLPPVLQIDPFYEPLLARNEKGEIPNTDAPIPPSPPIPKEIGQTYDCYALQEFSVLPENIMVHASTKCVETLYDRFPNITMRLLDKNNPNDVNDTSLLRLSTPKGYLSTANYNAHGAGVDYLFTGVEADFENDMYVPSNRKVIVQVNDDRSYLYWYWQDNAPFQVLDKTDLIAKSLLYPNDPDGERNKPTYNRSFDKLTWYNEDCSEKNLCGIPPVGNRYINEITRNDTFKVGNQTRFFVETFGVYSDISNYGDLTAGDEGGEIRVAIAPLQSTSKLKVYLYTQMVMLDYNSSIQHPPHFIWDESMGIDYYGEREYKVLAPDPYVNFSELRIVDHSLQFSEVNYTAGSSTSYYPPYAPMPIPTPQISAPYDPILKDVGRDFRAYPGGNTHITRMIGIMDLNLYFGYPAIWWWYWYDDVDMTKFTDFNRLGMEWLPFTDYGLYFILKDGDGQVLSMRPGTPLNRKINRIIVEGPFKTPLITNRTTGAMTIELIKGNMINLPLVYDWSGKIVIDSTNSQWYEYAGDDWTQVVGFGPDTRHKTYRNAIISDRRDLDYRGLDNIFRIDEIIPVGAGNTSITVELADGTKKVFQDCCAEPPTDGLTTHGLNITGLPETLEVGSDHKVEAKIEEFESYQDVSLCNDAYVYIWQDRGVRMNLSDEEYSPVNMDMDVQFGMVDSNPEGSPYSSAIMRYYAGDENAAVQYPSASDVNKDGKISFADYETEIMGTYDLASNTWVGGLVDGRTFNANNGTYVFDLSESTGGRLVDVGADIGFISMASTEEQGMQMADADHVISEWEICPIYVTAYKYGDDNNDRAFIPSEGVGSSGGMESTMVQAYSHEVYLAGEAKIDPVPKQDLAVSVSPSVITAGVVPELTDPSSPLTFYINDESGRAVDLTKGVDLGFLKGIPLRFRAGTEAIWKHLFVDDHPDPLPQYYWLRTDLHNEDDSESNNLRLYSSQINPFRPITADFSNASTGQYVFRGFCANDKGEFDVYVYTPDRTHMGIAKVKVEPPNLEYTIMNTEDPSQRLFTVPGDPDFVLTAGDNRLYKITVTARDARGLLLKGVTKGVSTCGGGIKNTARFTPYSSRPESWNFSERDRFTFAEHFVHDLYPYNLNLGFDFNDNQKLDIRNSELYQLGGFNHIKKGLVYYNTTNVLYEQNNVREWDVTPNVNLPPFSDPITQKPIRDGAPQRPENPSGTATIGWGLGSIYNSPYHGGYLIADLDETGYLDYHDSLGLDVNGQTTFYLFAEDLAWVGGLVGQNAYCNNLDQADLVGNPPPNKTDPGTVYKRYHQPTSAGDYSASDGVFFLDWEAFPNKEIIVGAPKIKVLYAENRMPLGKNLVDSDKYDLTYSIENHLIVQVTPADPRDLPISEDGRIFMFGNQHQTAIYGNLKPSPQDPTIMETTLHFTPTGLGAGIAALGFYNKNKSYLQPPYDLKNTSTYTLMNLEYFDSAIGLYVEALTDGPVVVKQANELTVRVKEIGTMAPVEGATVKIEGPGISGTKTTDKSGVAIFPITANAAGIIKVTATKEGRNIGYKEIRILEDLTKPFLDIMPLPPYTNKPDIEVTGYTNPGNTVIINGAVTVTADNNGAFKGKVTLKEGLNTIIVESRNAKGEFVKGSVTTTLDTVPPNIFIDDPGELVDVTETAISGRTEPESTVLVNGVPFTLTHDIFRGTAKVVLGKNAITVTATDKAGNQATATRDIYVYHKIVIKITIDNPVALINDVPQPPLEASPFIWQGRTMVPVRLIAEGLGAQVNYDALTKTVTVILGNDTIVMKIDDKYATINGKSVLLDAPPTIRSGRTFIPVRFVSEAFRAQVDWDAATRTVTVTYKK